MISSFQEQQKLDSFIKNNLNIKCSCGHSIDLFNKTKAICSHCGKWVFKNKDEEFRYRLNQKIKNTASK